MSAQTIFSMLLPIISLLNDTFMALSPAKAATKIYKFDKKEVKSQIIDLIRANGVSACSMGLAEMPMSFTGIDSSKAVAIGSVPSCGHASDISSPLYKGVPAILSLFHLLRSPNCDMVIMPRH